MSLQLLSIVLCPLMAGYAGHRLGGQSGFTAGVAAYYALYISLNVASRYRRLDDWASKLAMFKAEEAELHLALAREYREQAGGPTFESKQAILDAYRARLALLQISMKVLQGEYLSEKNAMPLAHASEKWSGLADAAR
jgi:hypothetical protein